MIRRTLLLAALVLLGGGCSMFRAQAGLGIGLGVDVQIPALLHTGIAVGSFENVGPLYMRAGRPRQEEFVTAIIWHYEAEKEIGSTDPFGARADRERHACWAFLPPATTYAGDDLGKDIMPYSFELGVALLFFDFRIGFNPVAAFY